jgi:methyl-accepting chemotaxis protein
MSQPNDLESRVAALETEVRELKGRVRSTAQDAAAARVLAGGADHDVAEIRGEIREFRWATTASFNAMREDLNDLRSGVEDGFAEVNRNLDEINGKFAEVDRGFMGVRGRLDATAAGQQQIVGMLNTLIGRHGDQSNC